MNKSPKKLKLSKETLALVGGTLYEEEAVSGNMLCQPDPDPAVTLVTWCQDWCFTGTTCRRA